MLHATLCVAAALALLLPSSAHAVYPGTNGAVAYYDFAFTTAVEWSPDGSRRAYQEDFGRLLVATNADGSGRTVLYDLVAHGYNGLHGFGWSADGTQLVIAPYTSCGSGCIPKSDLVVISADGAQQDQITNTPTVDDAYPEWSPDGSRIAFERGGVVSLIDPDGTALQSLGAGDAPSWSPDQTKLAYSQISCWDPQAESCLPQIHLMNPDGSQKQMLVPTDCQVDYPCTSTTPIWSPDGSRIAFASDRYGGFGDTDIWMMDRDGSNQHFITDSGFEDYVSDWRAIPIRHVRPKGATPVEVSLVPAYRQCTAANRTHGPPLAHGSCAPPQRTSSHLTVGTPDSNGRQANGSGFVRYDTVVGNPSTPADEADITIYLVLRDIRNASGLSDYTGEVVVAADLRITDRLNAPYPGGGGPGTAQDASLAAVVPCAATPDASTGATCTLATSMDALSPGAAKEGGRAIWRLGQIHVDDGGADGLASTQGDNERFLNAGIFVP